MAFGSIIHSNDHFTGHHITHMSNLTAIGTGDRFYTFRPFPTGLECCPHRRQTAKIDHLYAAFRHVSDLFGIIETFVYGFSHKAPPKLSRYFAFWILLPYPSDVNEFQKTSPYMPL